MNTVWLRSLIRKYGAFGVLFVAGYLWWHGLSRPKRALWIAIATILFLLPFAGLHSPAYKRTAHKQQNVAPHLQKTEPTPSISEPDLFAAISHDDLSSAEALLDQGADIHRKNKDGDTPLVAAIFAGSPDMIRLLLKRGAAKNQNEIDEALGMMPAIGGVEVARLLIRYGANVQMRGSTLLHGAALRGGISLDMVKLFLDKGAKVDARDDDGDTPLMLAAEKQPTDLLELLVSRGANVHARNKLGMTALMEAASGCNPDNVRFLLRQGANPYRRDKEGHTTLMWAARGSDKNVTILLNKGVPVNARAKDGMTALICVARVRNRFENVFFPSGEPDVVKMLLASGADYTMKDEEGKTALMWAKSHERTEIVNLLKKAGAKE